MMLEELQEVTSLRALIGRCVHWDTKAPAGLAPEDAVCQHADVAVNFYVDEAREARLAGDLSKGKVEDASFYIRSHQ